MKRGKKKAWFYSMPFLIIVGLMIVVPLLYTVEISFTNMSIYHWKDYHCVGLDNYKKALLAFDSGFLPAFLRTLLWTVSSMALQLIFGFFIAVGLNAKGLKLRRVYKTLLIVPWAMPAYVSILLWRMGIFNTEFGLFNQILKQIGGKTVNFLSTNGMAFISCLVVNLWLGVPYMFTMMDGAMQSIDRNIYESAELDGAGFWKKHFYVTIPQILPILMPVIIMATFTAFKQFDIVYLMTMQTGSKTGADINTVIMSGFTANMIARYKPGCQIIGCTLDEKVYRQLNLLWGVKPVMIQKERTTDALFEEAVFKAKQAGLVKTGDTVVITAGVPLGVVGKTDMIHVVEVE
jgi:arabinogalactan oligomer/maltooligosaccharide transport system permease protein